MISVQLVDGTNVVRRKIEAGKHPFRPIASEIAALPATTIQVWCWEGHDAKAPRRAMLPAYKETRVRPIDGTFELLRGVREMLRHTRALQVAVPEREADDCIAALAERLAADPNIVEVLVRSNDADFGQLTVVPKIRLEVEAKVPGHLMRLYKATRGDPADNVGGVKGFGEGAWTGIADHAGFHDAYLAYLAGAELEWPDLKPGVRNWCAANRETSRAMWDVVGFLPITPADLDAGTVTGVPDAAALATFMKGVMA